jgi:hypothetical protein
MAAHPRALASTDFSSFGFFAYQPSVLSRTNFEAIKGARAIWNGDGERMAFYIDGALAQFNSIDWNHDNVITAATVVIAVLNIFLALGTILLWFTTRRLVKSSEKTAERQLRAYVFQEGVSLFDGTNLDSPQINRTDWPGFSMSIKNFGQTPAYDVIHWARIEILDSNREDTLIPPNPKRGTHAMSLAPNASFTKSAWFDRPLSDKEKQAIVAGSQAIFVYGRIDYVDAFRKPHFTTYRLIYSKSFYPPVGKGAVFSFCTNGNTTDDKYKR